MAVKNEQQSQDIKRIYMFRRCPSCGNKLHTCAILCFKCGKRHNYNANTGKWEDVIYGSENENDAVYDMIFNNVDKCLICRNTQNGSPCKPIYCFGSGKGDCDACNRFESIRFMCCQEIVKFDNGLKNDSAKKQQFDEYMAQMFRESIQPFKKQNGCAG